MGAGATAQTTVDLNIDQARSIATQALLSNDPALALQIAEAILTQLPDDRAALIVVAAAAPQLGDPDRGRVAGARAFAVSRTDAQKYEAARLTALAAANDQRFTLATFWLRRALTVAPNDQERTRTLRDARGVSRLNPWSTQLSFSLAPSNNVNGGAEGEDLIIAGQDTGGNISQAGLALAGWRASLGFGTQYRLHQSRTNRTTVGIQLQTARAWITEDTTLPDEAFDTASYTLSLRHERALERGTLTFRVARSLYEYRRLENDERTTQYQNYDTWLVGVDRRYPLNDRTVLSLSVNREQLSYLNTGIGDIARLGLIGGVSYQLASGDQISASFALTDSDGDNLNYTSGEQTLSGSYRFADPIGPMSLALGGGLRWSDYPDYRVGFSTIPGGRQDTTVFANANIGFPNVSYAGFTPGLRIDANRVKSNVSRFERTTFSAGLTISSQF
ncbi:hypothetical protein [Yoonia algicola]|uniref:DUF560 domain-containing protein n=1 Tax=Yoonia algicola TaxID=3137368 RepID=A0AAN0NGH0_9RHOB